MIKLLILTIFLYHNGQVLASTSLAHQNDVQGPITNIMENLAIHTSSVTDELLAQLSAKIERTTKTILGDIEVVVAGALQQLSEPIVEAENKINSPECQASLSLDELQQRIDLSLMTCTRNLTEVLHTFEADAEEFNEALKLNVKEIMELPSQCQILDNSTGFSGTLSCYVEKISEINQQMAVVLNRASLTLLQTRQIAKQGVISARECANDVVVDTLEFVNDILSKCDISDN